MLDPRLLDELTINDYTFCDKEIVKKRLENRKLGNGNYSIANYDDYIWMVENVEKVDDNLISYTIDTSKDLEIQVKDFINKYKIEC